jgi:hypothetical protein
MAAGIQFTGYVPTALVGVNSPSPTLAAEVVTGLPIPTGAFPGNTFYLTETQANQLSQFPINGATQLICHAGWYMVVKVSESAVAANIVAGSIGAQKAIPLTQVDANKAIPSAAVVTDYATAGTAPIMLGCNPVVFLNPVTPGNFTIVQIGGDASVLLSAGVTTSLAAGAMLVSQVATQGVIVSTTYTALIVGLAETATVLPGGALTLTAAAAASGGTTVYTGTITGGAANAFAGLNFTIAGFVTAANNGVFKATASSATTLTLANTAGVAETHAGTATFAASLIRANVAFPFGTV